MTEQLPPASGTVHQLLHGYKAGHVLLQSSVKLPRTTRRVILPLSDISGSSASRRFEPYITCYPLPDIACQAIAKTWPATEMRRPGSVWTHTLLISFADLARVEDLLHLTSLFRRPTGRDLSEYTTPLAMPGTKRASTSPVLDRRLVRTLYERPKTPVVVVNENQTDYELAVFALWSQQWPRLRRCFRFCTGSFSSRTSMGQDFDLQVTSPSRERSLQRDLPEACYIYPEERRPLVVRTQPQNFALLDTKHVLEPLEEPAWLGKVLNDLANPDAKFRSFLRAFGADVRGTRDAMVALTESFIAVDLWQRGHLSTLDLCSGLGKRFPSREDASSLKTALFGVNGSPAGFSDGIPNNERLLALLCTPEFSAYDFDVLGVPGALHNALRRHGHVDWSEYVEIRKRDLNEAAEEHLKNFHLSLEIPEVISAFDEERDAFCMLVSENPSIAEDVRIWRAKRPVQIATLHVLKDSGALGSLAGIVGRYIVKADSYRTLNTLVDETSPGVLPEILECLSQTSEEVKPGRWTRLFGAHPEQLEHWVESSGCVRWDIFSALCHRLDPASPGLERVSISQWFAILDTAPDDPEQQQVAGYCFVLAWAFNSELEAAVELVVAAFPPVWNAVECSHLTVDGWAFLTPFLKSAFFLRGAPSNRLAEALAEQFIYHSWPKSALVEIIGEVKNPASLERKIRESAKGREFLGHGWLVNDN